MARPTSPILTEAELRLMNVLWSEGPSSVARVGSALDGRGTGVAPSTIRTVLGILRQKRYVALDSRGRAHVYRAIVSKEQARKQALRHLLSTFFEGSREELVLSLMRDEGVARTELTRLRRIILEDG